MVNRIWRWHFGQGLVRSVDNFGLLGDRPTTRSCSTGWPALVADGWSIKRMHRPHPAVGNVSQSSSTHISTQHQHQTPTIGSWGG